MSDGGKKLYKPAAIASASDGVNRQPSQKHAADDNDVSDALSDKWKIAISDLGNQIKVRHYSPKTLKSYATWVRKLQRFSRNKDPQLLTTQDVKAFSTDLAFTQKVSASSQNQAFNALLFFFRHVLNREFGKINGVGHDLYPFQAEPLRRRKVPLIWFEPISCLQWYGRQFQRGEDKVIALIPGGLSCFQL